MSELNDLYQEVILDHNKNPRNFREIETATRTADGNNPLCGDALRVYVEMENDCVKDVAFKGSGCAISTSTSIYDDWGQTGIEVVKVSGTFASPIVLYLGPRRLAKVPDTLTSPP